METHNVLNNETNNHSFLIICALLYGAFFLCKKKKQSWGEKMRKARGVGEHPILQKKKWKKNRKKTFPPPVFPSFDFFLPIMAVIPVLTIGGNRAAEIATPTNGAEISEAMATARATLFFFYGTHTHNNHKKSLFFDEKKNKDLNTPPEKCR